MYNPETMVNGSNKKENAVFDYDFSRFLNFSHNQSETFENLTDSAILFWREWSNWANIALSKFKWSFPAENEQLNAEFLEKLLFYKGRCAIIRDKNNGLMVVDYLNTSVKYNMFGVPTRIQAVDIYDNGRIIGEYGADDFVLVRNNKTMYPTNLTIWSYSNEIVQCLISQNVNVSGQKNPIVIQTSDREKLSSQNFAIQYDMGYPFIFVSKDYNLNDITKLELSPKFIANDINDIVQIKRNDLATALGVNNNNVNKESGVSDYEVSANNQLVQIESNLLLSMRKLACDECLEKFGIECSVDFNNMKGVSENESIYDEPEFTD